MRLTQDESIQSLQCQDILRPESNLGDFPLSQQPLQIHLKSAIHRPPRNENDEFLAGLVESQRTRHFYTISNFLPLCRAYDFFRFTRFRQPVNVPATATFFPPPFQSRTKGTFSDPRFSFPPTERVRPLLLASLSSAVSTSDVWLATRIVSNLGVGSLS